MTQEEKQILLTTAWFFMLHGQPGKAKVLCQEVNDTEPDNGPCAALLAQLLLDNAEPQEALQVVLAASFPQEMARIAALLQARALRESGRPDEGEAAWNKYLQSRNKQRRWVVES